MAERLYYRAGKDSDEWVEDIKNATVEFEAIAQTIAMRFPGCRVEPLPNRRGNQKWVVTKEKDSGKVMSLRGSRN